MGTIADMLKRVKSVQMDQIIQQSVDQTKDSIPELNKHQLEVGLLATSNPIVPKYSPSYAKKKGFTTPNLYVSGDFYRGLYTTVNGNTFTTNSSDIKAFPLETKYSKFIFGLTKDSKTAYSLGVLRPVLNKNLREAIGI